jgi:hypothetical protein
MTERYHAGVYWPARLESAEECARRSVTFFRLLSQCDEIYARWYEQGDSVEEALQREFTPDYATFLQHLSLGRRVQEVLDSKELLRPVLS